ncbi:RNA polymerase sigma factor, sigma-70 family [Oligella ureolytica]|uniref:RNA polymerase sigma factor n=1 Tax=Oligella ureolytica TaxID=90244 RepID=UPI000DFA0541|nr:sigma factor-like helix-turn-helix DNA-binding protein [Oligella ureolytica]SUA57155.1 RNA polymerase sigma factor, sigma-70 family [Oligella ureolytica]
MRNSYLDLRLSQWAEYHSKGYLPSIAERVFFGGDNELSRLEREAHRLTKVKRTAAAIESLNDEYKAIIYGRYLAKMTLKRIGEEIGLSSATVSRRLSEAGHQIQTFFDTH